MQSQSDITSYNALPPAVLRTIRETFESTIGELEQRHGSHAVTDYTRAALARQIVRLARSGVCNPRRLQAQALSVVHL
jgi:hypothetical protein